MPLFSIIVPVYNEEKYLESCINSVLTQTCTDFEVILIDDGSTDSSGSMCENYKEKYPDKITVFHKKNAGLMLARKDGYSLARGKYIINLDSDDFIEKKSLESIKKIIEESSPDIILYDLYYYQEGIGSKNSNEGKYLVKPNSIQDIKVLRDALINLSYANWSMASKCVKSDYIKRLALCFSEDYRKVAFGEDTLQSIELYNMVSTFVYCPEHIYNYRSGSGMTKKLGIKHLADFYKIKRFIIQNCNGWTENVYNSANKYFLLAVCMNINNLISVNAEKDEIYARFKAINEVAEFRKELADRDNNPLCDGMRKVDKSILGLLYNKRYHLLYMLLEAKKMYSKIK